MVHPRLGFGVVLFLLALPTYVVGLNVWFRNSRAGMTKAERKAEDDELNTMDF